MIRFRWCLLTMTLLRGVKRSKQMAMRWLRKAAEDGDNDASFQLALRVYQNHPYAREVGHVGEADTMATPAVAMEGHDVPTDVLTGVAHWLRTGGYDVLVELDMCRRTALNGGAYCCNEGCEVVGHLKDFKVCPQCKTVRYCGAACQKADWTAGGHKELCGTATNSRMRGSGSRYEVRSRK